MQDYTELLCSPSVLPEPGLSTAEGWGWRRERSITLHRQNRAPPALSLCISTASFLPGLTALLPPVGVPVWHLQSLQGALYSVSRGQSCQCSSLFLIIKILQLYKVFYKESMTVYRRGGGLTCYIILLFY